MATYAAARFGGLAVRPVTARIAGTVLLGLLVSAAVLLRTTELHIGYWVDEGLSVGIASHPLADIPHLLRQDGAPPLYYVLLHGWIGLFGTGEAATRSLSVVFAGLTVPAALWGAGSLFGSRAGWIAAGGAALSPFLTVYAQETRMYALVVLLGIVFAAAFVHVFFRGRRRLLPLFAISLALLLYTHGWALFLCVASLAALPLSPRMRTARRALLADAAIGYGIAAALFAPWIPTLLFQAAHTGAPWSVRPSVSQLIAAPTALLGGGIAAAALAVGVTRGARVLRRDGGPAGAAIGALGALTLLVPLLGWLASQISPAWTGRYLAMALGPFLLMAAGVLARARRVELVVIAVVAVAWALNPAPRLKSNVREAAQTLSGQMRPADVVVSTQPEQLPTIVHYLRVPGIRTVTLLGTGGDPSVVDWRDGVERVRDGSAERTLEPVLDRLAIGRRLLLARPLIGHPGEWKGPWLSAVRTDSTRWARELAGDARFRLVAVSTPRPLPGDPGPHSIGAALYEKVRR